MARKNKAFFFDSPDNSSGRKFSRHNHPTKEIFIDLFDSIPFLKDAEDTAKESEAGHTKRATDTEALARATSSAESKAVQPHQLPTVTVGALEVLSGDMTAAGIKVTAIEKIIGGKKRLTYKIESVPDYSLQIDPVSEKLMLKNDIKVPLAPSHEELFYGIRNGVRSFFKVLPDFAVGALKCRYITPGGGDPNYYELYWDDAVSNNTVYSRNLLGSFTSVNYTGPTGRQVLKSYNLGAADMLIGTVIKVRGVFEMAANLGRSKVGCIIGLTTGEYAAEPLVLRSDGNTSGMVELEGTIRILSDEDTPEFLIYNGKSFNSALPSEVIVQSSRTLWNFAPATGALRIELVGERSNTSGSIVCHSLEVELIR